MTTKKTKGTRMKNSLNTAAAGANMKDMEKRTIMIAVLGTSPSVLTETVWALYKEKPDYLPEEVFVLTTTRGRACAEERLKSVPEGETASVWQQLAHKVGKDTMELRFYEFEKAPAEGAVQPKGQEPDKMRDITNTEDQNLMADQMLRLMRMKKAEYGKNCRVVCSIAGGRKSMSALLYAVMSLAGGSDDIITHVLADDHGSNCREFFYPDQRKQRLKTDAKGEAFTAKSVRLELAEIPFVPLGSLIDEHQVKMETCSFDALMKLARQDVLAMDTTIELNGENYSAKVNGREPAISMKPGTYLMLALAVRSRMLDLEEESSPETINDAYSPMRMRRVYNLLKEENLFSLPKAKGDREYRMIREVCSWLEDPNVSPTQGSTKPQACLRLKTNLKNDLQKEGLHIIANDLRLSEHSSLRFTRIHKVGFVGKPARPDKSTPAKEAKPTKKKKK